MPDVLIPVGHHGTPPVPLAPTDDVYFGGQKGIGVADHRSDVEVVLPVLHGDVERMPPLIEIGDDRLARPVAVPVDHVASVAVSEQLRVETGVIGPRLRVRADPHLAFVIGHAGEGT